MDNLKRNTLPNVSRPEWLALKYSPEMARSIQRIAESHPRLADALREELWRIQCAQHCVRRLLARHRIEVRRVPVLAFKKRLL